MFIPKVFQQTQSDEIKYFIATHPLATIVAQTINGLEASHIPMYWEDDGSKLGCLYGHMTKTNPLNSQYERDDRTKILWLAIFQDSGHYISPNWYPSKALRHKAVPTWNYQAVHISGTVDILTDTESLIQILSKQTADFEADQPVPWSLNDAPEKYIHAMSRAIVGIRFHITDIQAQFKLSQNKSEPDKNGVINGLHKLGTPEASKMAYLIADED